MYMISGLTFNKQYCKNYKILDQKIEALECVIMFITNHLNKKYSKLLGALLPLPLRQPEHQSSHPSPVLLRLLLCHRPRICCQPRTRPNCARMEHCS